MRRFFHILARVTREWPGLLRATYRAWRNPPVYPHTLQIEHTNRCNLKCVMCAHGTGTVTKLPDMDFDFVAGLLRQFKATDAPPGLNGLSSLFLQGIGEPFLHKQTLPIIREARRLGLNTNFTTNMTILTDELARELIASGQEAIVISVDAIDPAKFADIRRGAKYDVLQRIVDNLERLKRIKQEVGSQTPHVVVNSLLMKHTLPDVPELVRRLRELGVARIMFSDVQTHGMDPAMSFDSGLRCAEQSLLAMPREEKLRALAAIKALGTPECQITVDEDIGGVSQRKRDDLILTCSDLWEKPYVTAGGYVTPCCYSPTKDTLPMGNLREHSFEEIWFGPAYQRLRWQHLSNRHPGECKNCTQLVRRVATTHLRDPDSTIPAYTKVFMGRHRFSLGLATARKAKRFL